jgi:hypothetical protein
MSLASLVKHSIELIVVVGILYIAYLTFYPGAVAIGKAASASDVHERVHHPYVRLVWGSSRGSSFIRPSRLK